MTPEEAKATFENACADVGDAMQSFIPIPGEMLVVDLQEIFQAYRDAGFIVTIGGTLGNRDMAMFTRPEAFAIEIDGARDDALAQIEERRTRLQAELAQLEDDVEDVHRTHAARMARVSAGVMPWP